MAKDLVRTRNYIKKFYLMKANIQAISLKLQVISSAQPHTQASCTQPGYEAKPNRSVNLCVCCLLFSDDALSGCHGKGNERCVQG